MSLSYFAPSWFFGYDIALELIFTIITFVVAMFALKIYKATDQKQVKLFGISFLLMSISYFIESIFNFMILSKANEEICRVIKIQSIIFFDTMGIYAHMILMTLGLVTLVYMTFKTKKKRIFWLLLLTSLSGIILSRNKLYIFFVLSTIYLAFISWHFITNYLKNKQKKTLLIALAFLLLLFGDIHFMFSVNHQPFYVIGHVLELFAYLLILWNFYLVRK